MTVPLSVCLSAVRLAVWVKQKDVKQTKQTASEGCIHMLFFFSPHPVFSLSGDKLGLERSETPSWSCQDCSYGPWHPPVSLHFSDFTAADCCTSTKMPLDETAHLPSDPFYTEQDTTSLHNRLGNASFCIHKANHPENTVPILCRSEGISLGALVDKLNGGGSSLFSTFSAGEWKVKAWYNQINGDLAWLFGLLWSFCVDVIMISC